jgi:transcriptional regulator with XRE-family HTH domain
MNQRTLSDLSGVSQAAISRYEHGESDLGGVSVAQLCRVLGCSADYLLGLTDDPRPYRDLNELTDAERRLLSAWHENDLHTVIKLLAAGGNTE